MSRESDQRVFMTLAETGVPGTRIAWLLDERPAPPRFRYECTNGGELHADGLNFAALPRYRVELLTIDNDPDLLDVFSLAVADLGPYAYHEEWDTESGLYKHVYEFTYCGE